MMDDVTPDIPRYGQIEPAVYIFLFFLFFFFFLVRVYPWFCVFFLPILSFT